MKVSLYLMARLMVGFESLHFPTLSVRQIGKQWDSTAASLYPFYINVWWVLFGSIQPSHSMAAATLGLLKHSIFQWWKKCRRCGLQEDNPQCVSAFRTAIDDAVFTISRMMTVDFLAVETTNINVQYELNLPFSAAEECRKRQIYK